MMIDDVTHALLIDVIANNLDRRTVEYLQNY